jgi:hypothetical protein
MGQVCFLAVALSSGAYANFDLTPTPHEFVSEGINYRELLFKHDKKQVSYIPPDRWSWRGGSNRLVLTPPGQIQAEASIEHASLAAPRPLDAGCTQELVQRALHSVPPQSQNVTIVQQLDSPVIMNGNPTLEVIVSYENFGQLFHKSTLFLHLPDAEVVFRLTARKSDFESLHNTFRKSLISWQWL